jgi:hypothetical protein
MNSTQLAEAAAATQRWNAYCQEHRLIIAADPKSEQAILGKAYRVAIKALDQAGDVAGLVYVSDDPDYYTFEVK